MNDTQIKRYVRKLVGVMQVTEQSDLLAGDEEFGTVLAKQALKIVSEQMGCDTTGSAVEVQLGDPMQILVSPPGALMSFGLFGIYYYDDEIQRYHFELETAPEGNEKRVGSLTEAVRKFCDTDRADVMIFVERKTIVFARSGADVQRDGLDHTLEIKGPPSEFLSTLIRALIADKERV